jgi:hypothetical protein
MALNASQTRGQDNRREEILSAQVRLIYANANLAVCITIIAATILASLQWKFVSSYVVLG